MSFSTVCYFFSRFRFCCFFFSTFGVIFFIISLHPSTVYRSSMKQPSDMRIKNSIEFFFCHVLSQPLRVEEKTCTNDATNVHFIHLQCQQYFFSAKKLKKNFFFLYGFSSSFLSSHNFFSLFTFSCSFIDVWAKASYVYCV